MSPVAGFGLESGSLARSKVPGPVSYNPPCAKEQFVLTFGRKNRRHRAIAMAVHILLIAFSCTILSVIEDLTAICL